jgi:peptidoglycan-binding protein ArfA
MPDSEDIGHSSETRAVSKFYRRAPGLGWLVGLLLIPLLLGAVGYGVQDRADRGIESTPPSVDPSATLTVPNAAAPSPNLPGMSFAPLSIVRAGNDVTLSGELPDGATKASLLDILQSAFGPDVNMVDNLNIKSGAKTPDVSDLGGLFKAAATIPDFNFDLNGTAATLTGTAPSGDVSAAVDAAAKTALPNMTMANNIRVEAAPPGAPTPTVAAPGAPMSPGAPAPPAPGAPGAAGACADLQADIAGLLRTPINFSTNGFTLDPGSQQVLTQVAQKLTACSDARVAVTGYTDDSGNDAINVPLSRDRANSVADFLMSHGVAGDRITSQGLGSADPVATNGTTEGQAQNRRVEITVS